MSDFDFRGARDVIWDSGLSVYTKAVFIQLVEHMPHCRPGLARLCQRTSLSRAQVIREIHTLEKLDCIVVTRSNGIGNSYSLADGWNTRLPVSTSNQYPPATGIHEIPDPSPPDTGGVSTSNRTSIHQTPKADLKQDLKQEGKQSRARAKSHSPSKARRTKAVETTLPDSWQPTDEHRAFATENGLELDLELVKFRGYYDGKKCLSWNGRFSTWLANAVTYAKRDSQRIGNTRSRGGPAQPGINPRIQYSDEPEPPPNQKVIPIRKTGAA